MADCIKKGHLKSHWMTFKMPLPAHLQRKTDKSCAIFNRPSNRPSITQALPLKVCALFYLCIHSDSLFQL